MFIRSKYASVDDDLHLRTFHTSSATCSCSTSVSFDQQQVWLVCLSWTFVSRYVQCIFIIVDALLWYSFNNDGALFHKPCGFGMDTLAKLCVYLTGMDIIYICGPHCTYNDCNFELYRLHIHTRYRYGPLEYVSFLRFC